MSARAITRINRQIDRAEDKMLEDAALLLLLTTLE